MVPLVIVLGGLSYVMYLQGQDPFALLTAPFEREQAAAGLPGATPAVPAGKPLRTIDATSRVYRWRDADGNMHFSDTPPGDGAGFESIEIDPDANLIKGVGGSSEGPRPEAGAPALPANPYHPDSIKRLFEQAEAVKETLNQRYREQQQLLER